MAKERPLKMKKQPKLERPEKEKKKLIQNAVCLQAKTQGSSRKQGGQAFIQRFISAKKKRKKEGSKGKDWRAGR